MDKKYVVRLSDEERGVCQEIIKKLKGASQKAHRAKSCSRPTPPKLDGKGEAKLIALRLGKPPTGYGHWTLQLLAAEPVTLEVVDSIRHETVRKPLKNGMTKRKSDAGVRQPQYAHQGSVL